MTHHLHLRHPHEVYVIRLPGPQRNGFRLMISAASERVEAVAKMDRRAAEGRVSPLAMLSRHDDIWESICELL
jgi:hypothetical protein